MKSVKETLLGRRTIRRYERKPIEPEKLDYIYEAIRNAPTSYNGQQFSVIAISDQAVKEEIHQITGQKQIKTCAIFLVFCLDYHKVREAARLQGVETPPFETTIDGYTVGVIDASLAMMSAVVAAESVGLATCSIGYARTADPTRLSALVKLPKGVSIVCGLALGYPNEMPDLKPKLPVELVVHQGQYTPDEAMRPKLAAYDVRIREFNQTRAGDQTDNDWSTRIANYHRHSMEHGIAGYLEKQLGLK